MDFGKNFLHEKGADLGQVSNTISFVLFRQTIKK